jgi:hypothetical protein
LVSLAHGVDEWDESAHKKDTDWNCSRRRIGLALFLSCLIKAGKNRCLVAKVAERKQYEAATRHLGWLDGKQPPWEGQSSQH